VKATFENINNDVVHKGVSFAKIKRSSST